MGKITGYDFVASLKEGCSQRAGRGSLRVCVYGSRNTWTLLRKFKRSCLINQSTTVIQRMVGREQSSQCRGHTLWPRAQGPSRRMYQFIGFLDCVLRKPELLTWKIFSISFSPLTRLSDELDTQKMCPHLIKAENRRIRCVTESRRQA